MKKLTIILTLCIGLGHLSHAQIIDSLPFVKQQMLLDKLVNPFLKGVVYNEGVAALRQYIDPGFKPPVKGWIRDSMFNHIRQKLSVVEFQDGDDLFLLSDCEFFSLKGETPDSELVVVAVAAPEITNPASQKGPYDPLGTQPEPGSAWGTVLTDIYDVLYGNPKFKDPDNVLGLLLRKQPNGQYKVCPDAYIVLGESDMRAQGLLTDDGTLVLLVKKFLKSIRENDKNTFRSVFDEDLVRSKVWTDMRPLSQYRKLPEYKSSYPQSENVVILELEDDFMLPEGLITWGGDVATAIAVYRLPKGKTASKYRAPSDVLNSKVWKQLGLKDLEAQDKIIGFTKTPDGFNYRNNSRNQKFLDQLIGKGNDPENFITVILVREKGTNNFNIGMPPTLK